jgi:hypothetical protein
LRFGKRLLQLRGQFVDTHVKVSLVKAADRHRSQSAAIILDLRVGSDDFKTCGAFS